MNVLALHFAHIETYPPAFNAINTISSKVDKIHVICVDTVPSKFKYRKNVSFDLIEGGHDRFKFAKRTRIKKLSTYFNFVNKTRSFIKNNQVDLIIVYDDIPFLFYRMASFALKNKPLIWYHNHDILPLGQYKKFSLVWLGAFIAKRSLKIVDFFSLPAVERKVLYPLNELKGDYFTIPNYPSSKIIKIRSGNKIRRLKEIRLVYPGSPSYKNGFENLLSVMHEKINNQVITLTIIGETDKYYKDKLLQYARKMKVEKQLFFVDRVSYIDMPLHLQQYDVGWGVYKPVDMSVATAGTSSNKIYEFMANALPVIVMDNENHRKYLSDCDSVIFTNLERDNIKENLRRIESNLAYLSKKSRDSFEEEFQFEKRFEPILEQVIDKIKLIV